MKANLITIDNDGTRVWWLIYDHFTAYVYILRRQITVYSRKHGF